MASVQVNVSESALAGIDRKNPDQYISALKSLQSGLKDKPFDEILKKSPLEGHHEFNHGKIKLGGLLRPLKGEFEVKFIQDHKDVSKMFTPSIPEKHQSKQSDLER